MLFGFESTMVTANVGGGKKGKLTQVVWWWPLGWEMICIGNGVYYFVPDGDGCREDAAQSNSSGNMQ